MSHDPSSDPKQLPGLVVQKVDCIIHQAPVVEQPDKLIRWTSNYRSVSILQKHLTVRVIDSRSSGPGSGPDWGHCVVFLGKTLYSHGASLHPGV